ncbi:MAG: 3-phosphoshikimate 1-carboxyvinyltransferase, partial [Firmicutes bacterium]|nr:3-phosphoshikimate 1-carboxyvinyltransferase [Bacillota bacterium]
YYVPGNISSQFISGLLFALPLAKDQGESTIHVTPPLESAPYIDLTLDALNKYGVTVSRPDKYTFVIPSGQRYQPYSGDVEGDWSNAAFFIALKCLGFDVCVSGLNQNSLQGDRVCSDMMENLTHSHAVISVSECPDIAPILMTVGALCHGVTLTDTSRLKIKESDRGEAMAQELYKLGVECEVYENKIVVPKCALHAPNEVIDGHNDHRVVMAMATALLFLGGEITGAEAVRKSLPDYFEIIKSLGGEVEEIEA